VFFIPFQRLALELRTKVWSFTIEPREVKLRARAPAILYVCHESREFALKVYKLCFNDDSNKLARVYLNTKIDTLYLLEDELANVLAVSKVPRPSYIQFGIKKLVVEISPLGWSAEHAPTNTACFNALRSFGTLEELIIVTNNTDWAETLEEFRDAMDKRYEKESQIWDLFRKQGRKCSTYSLPKFSVRYIEAKPMTILDFGRKVGPRG
jgi:hypothetical protein